MTKLLTRQASIATVLLLAGILAGQDMWTDPVAATAEDPDFSIQGEYRTRAAGIQVAALRDHKFLVSILPKGLPGAGWDGQEVISEIAGRDAVIACLAKEQAKPSDRRSPTLGAKPPAGAIVLFAEGAAQAAVDEVWQHGVLADGLLSQGAVSRQSCQDFRLHVEFRLPYKSGRTLSGQDHGNSGISISERYEVQIIDTFGLHHARLWTGEDGGTAWSLAFAHGLGKPTASKATQWCSALYLTKVPLINAALLRLTWQTYDIDFKAPRFEGAAKTANARISVTFNGISTQVDLALAKGIGQGGKKAEVGEGLIYLQDHKNPVRFRNIWLIDGGK